jgi:hypothetical protein
MWFFFGGKAQPGPQNQPLCWIFFFFPHHFAFVIWKMIRGFWRRPNGQPADVASAKPVFRGAPGLSVELDDMLQRGVA